MWFVIGLSRNKLCAYALIRQPTLCRAKLAQDGAYEALDASAVRTARGDITNRDSTPYSPTCVDRQLGGLQQNPVEGSDTVSSTAGFDASFDTGCTDG